MENYVQPQSGADALESATVRFFADAPTFATMSTHRLLGGGPRTARPGVLRTFYYDTDEGDLRRHGLTLQMRRAGGGRRAMGLKALGDGGAERDQVEVKAPGDVPQIELFPTPARDLIDHVTEQRPLKPWFSTQIRRASWRFDYEGAQIEVCFDQGEIVAGAHKEPVCEIELKLSVGPTASLYRLALALSDATPLRLGVSKFERGFQLVSERPHATRPLGVPELDAKAPADAAIEALLRRNLTHFLTAWAALDAAGDEAVHQIRVSLRRLRSLLSMLKPTFPGPENEYLRAQAKRIADAFGDSRNWRVFAERADAGPKRQLPDAPGLSKLIAQAYKYAEDGRVAAAEAVGASAVTRFVLSLQLFIATRGWRQSAAEIGLLVEPSPVFGARTLERCYGRLKKRARGFDHLSADDRHKMRIAIKQLRYAVDFFGPLFGPTSTVRAYAEKTSEVQERLGAANDANVARGLLDDIGAPADPTLAFGAGAVLGWFERDAAFDEDALRRAWKDLRKADRFWRDDLPTSP